MKKLDFDNFTNVGFSCICKLMINFKIETIIQDDLMSRQSLKIQLCAALKTILFIKDRSLGSFM